MNALRGALAGAIGTWLMDLVTQGMLDAQSADVKRREELARPNGKSSVENAVERLEDRFGLDLGLSQREVATQMIHFGLGVVPGALYAVLRYRIPLLGAGRGTVFGFLLWAINDEYLNTRLRLAGPFDAYPTETHLRGLVGHVVLGAATDTLVDVLGANRRA